MRISPRIRFSKKVIAIITTLSLFGGGSYLLGWSSLFTVSQIEITGAPSQPAQDEIVKKLDLRVGEKLARVDSRALSLRLKSADWIKSADISRNWFNGKVRVDLSLRIPVAIYSELGKPQVVLDASGELFKARGALPVGLPNISATSVSSGSEAIKVFTEMPKEFSDGITSINATSEINILVTGRFSEKSLQIIWGDGEDTLLKIKVVNALLEQPENKSIHMIDVTAPHAPIVK